LSDQNSSHNSSRNRESLRAKASAFFKEKADRNVAIYQQMETERVVTDTKIARLRALRLAKEESEREDANPAASRGTL
jgi:hypothetical protein